MEATQIDLSDIALKIRREIIRMVYNAQSGHPGGSLSVTDILTVLYFKEMNIDPNKPKDPKRDRLILSKGHASPALYATLAIRGFFPVSDLSGFRKLDSHLEGHVTREVPGVEVSTGSLGQGLGIGVGMALAGRLDGMQYRVYVILGDGEMEEGNVWESLMAGYKYNLNNITAILDKNGIQLDGYTKDIMPMHDIKSMVESFGWNVIEIDGHNYDQIHEAVQASKNSDRPTFIIANTVKGKGVDFMENNPKYHGSPPESKELFERAMKQLGEQI
ncbi:transketolase [Thermoplasma volcanium GSS1]|uniref:Transketolase n=1 Tax=Thermoplasma volcanium (strain ATCC 51530 / DSM 4299 / JCM 9571 / NBRC 15438 / GSS1) TaxID=273116 RepID=Q97AZ2_THEVO|nr:transketolase [Thermoplasma volcanium]BAB59809.1 transketolase [Thermoplasma volcanium GSS1]